jgi:hypothetical protein
MMFDPVYCNVCPDLKHAKSKLNQVKNIINRLKPYIKQKETYNVRPRPAADVKYDTIHNHFMCGHCRKFNNTEWNHVESELHETVFTLCVNAENGLLSSSEGHAILHLLAGYYPICYRTFESCMRKGVKNEQDS